MLSSAYRRTDRFAAATAALLLQLAFIAAFIHAFSAQAPPRQLERELTFFLPRLLPKPAPVMPVPRSTATPLSLPLFVLPPLSSIRPAPPARNAPPAGLQNFGRALFGCAPENYTSLTPQQRALCPNPAEGVAIQSAPNLLGTPSHVKDNAHWANALAHEKSPLLLPGAGECRGISIPCMVLLRVEGDGHVSGLLAASSDPESWPTYINPKNFMPPPPIKGRDVTPAQNTDIAPR